MINTLLKIKLINITPAGKSEIAHTTVICKTTESDSILSRFFDCFNMDDPNEFGNLFTTDVDIAPVWDFDNSDDLQLAEYLNEDNPFLLDDSDNTWIWHNINEYLYV